MGRVIRPRWSLHQPHPLAERRGCAGQGGQAQVLCHGLGEQNREFEFEPQFHPEKIP